MIVGTAMGAEGAEDDAIGEGAVVIVSKTGFPAFSLVEDFIGGERGCSGGKSG